MTRRADQHALVEFATDVVVELVKLDLGDREILLRWIKVMEVEPSKVAVVATPLAFPSFVFDASSLECSLPSKRAFRHAGFTVAVRLTIRVAVELFEQLTPFAARAFFGIH